MCCYLELFNLFQTIHSPVSVLSQAALRSSDSCEFDSYQQPCHWFLSRGRTMHQSRMQYHHLKWDFPFYYFLISHSDAAHRKKHIYLLLSDFGRGGDVLTERNYKSKVLLSILAACRLWWTLCEWCLEILKAN